jgi:bifunctional UDP-N-acetylglucosamine pyrophosphorylase/glucosamine-1-phosphate N-acetyltransferase
MGGDHPKALADINGKPILGHLFERIESACPRPTVVVGAHNGNEIIDRMGDRFDYVFQDEQLGTAHAVLCAKEILTQMKNITSLLVLYGDHPLVTAGTAKKLEELREKQNAAVAMATVQVPNFDADFVLFRNWGRVVRASDDTVLKVVEVKDATSDEKKITEVSPSFLCFEPAWPWSNLHLVKNDNAKKEYYLTDMVNIAIAQNKKIVTMPVPPVEAMGANTPQEIAIVSKYL